MHGEPAGCSSPHPRPGSGTPPALPSTSGEPRGRRPTHTPRREDRVTPAHTPAHSPTRTTPRHGVLAGRQMLPTVFWSPTGVTRAEPAPHRCLRPHLSLMRWHRAVSQEQSASPIPPDPPGQGCELTCPVRSACGMKRRDPPDGRHLGPSTLHAGGPGGWLMSEDGTWRRARLHHRRAMGVDVYFANTGNMRITGVYSGETG